MRGVYIGCRALISSEGIIEGIYVLRGIRVVGKMGDVHSNG